MAPAIHLGAERLLVIGVSTPQTAGGAQLAPSEAALCRPTLAAVGNAVARSINIRMTDLPLSPPRLSAAIDAATPTEERERARREYLEQYANVVVEPLFRDAAKTSSPTERMLTDTNTERITQLTLSYTFYPVAAKAAAAPVVNGKGS